MKHPPVLPESAPFTPAQRAWLNGFFAGLFSANGETQPATEPLKVIDGTVTPQATAVNADDGNWPWHDPTLELAERTRLAAGRPLALRLMAAMAQMDCGRCGYDCRRYADAIVAGSEAKLNLCVPGGKETHRAVKALVDEAKANAPATISAATAVAAGRVSPASLPSVVALSTQHPRHNARLVASTPLNAPDADKETRLVVFDTGESPCVYQPGDSLGVCPENDPDLVAAIIAALQARGDEPVRSPMGYEAPLRDVLMRDADLSACTTDLYAEMAACAKHSGEANTLRAMEKGEEVDEPGEILDVLDLLTYFPSARPDPAQLVATLNRLQPRLYSIASSPHAHPSHVHLTVAVVRYQVGPRQRKGVASTYLAGPAQNREVPVFVQTAHGFRLPHQMDAPVIMIGPGTGVAPFRAFLQERRALGATGRNWLFFGNPHRRSGFFFEEELTGYSRDGLLTRLDTAFSRDQPEKIYVQHAMATHAKDLWAWLNDGAHFYVCGDAKRMARDVDLTLKHIIAEQGGLSPERAQEYVADMARAGRYQRDIY